MGTSDNAGSELAQGEYVRHPYLQRRYAAAHSAFLLGFYAELDEYNWDHPVHGYDDGYSDAFSSSELSKAIEKGNKSYKNSLFRSGRIW